jgi:hypothetical protein
MLLMGCERQQTIPSSDFIARAIIPAPLWIPDSVADKLEALPPDKELDAWLIHYSTQQKQLEAIHG